MSCESRLYVGNDGRWVAPQMDVRNKELKSMRKRMVQNKKGKYKHIQTGTNKGKQQRDNMKSD